MIFTKARYLILSKFKVNILFANTTYSERTKEIRNQILYQARYYTKTKHIRFLSSRNSGNCCIANLNLLRSWVELQLWFENVFSIFVLFSVFPNFTKESRLIEKYFIAKNVEQKIVAWMSAHTLQHNWLIC